jgi:cytochrome b6-f complex iron-sulfur subunit
MATRPVSSSGGLVRLPLSEYPDLAKPGGSAKVLPDGFQDPVYVLALEDGRFAALSPICTHRGCTVEIEGARLVCPCHGSTYDREGTVLRGPAEEALQRFPVERTGDAILIRVSA